MRLIIAGGREYSDSKSFDENCLKIIRELKAEGFDTSKEALTIVSGMAKGADTLAVNFQKKYNLKLEKFPVTSKDWERHGKRAGHIRNEDMAVFASKDSSIGVLIAFWDGYSRGTKNMIDTAYRYHLKVYVVRYLRADGQLQ